MCQEERNEYFLVFMIMQMLSNKLDFFLTFQAEMKRELRLLYCGRKTAHQQRKNEDVVYNNTALRWN